MADCYLVNVKNYEAAARSFGRAVELDRKNGKYYYNLGIALFYQGNLSDALTAFNKALAFQSDIHESFWYIAAIYTKRKNWTEAALYWRKTYDAFGPDSKFGKYALEQLEKIKGQ